MASLSSSTPLIQLKIITDTDIINTFDTEGRSTIPIDTYTIFGTLEITLLRPIEIRQLSVKFHGQVACILSATDFFRNFEEDRPSHGDEIPLEKWETIDANSLGLVNKISRKALGQANASETLVNEQIMIIDKPQALKVGKSTWPFSIKIDNVDHLPPSILLPYHIIQYNLSAKIKLNSLSEKFKVAYWNSRMSTLRIYRHSDSSFSGERFANDGVNILPSPLSPTNTVNSMAADGEQDNITLPLTPMNQQQQPTWRIFDSSNADSFINEDNDSNNTDTSKPVENEKNNKQLLSVSKVIQIFRHTYPNMAFLRQSQQVQYRGSRKDRVSYGIRMKKVACLQQERLNFAVRFHLLTEYGKMRSMEYYLEQAEVYPFRAGDYTGLNKVSEVLVPRYRKLSRKEYYLLDYESGTELELYVSLNLPQISPRIQTDVLDISHKLKMILTFVDSQKERKMSLSFPVTLGTVPRSSSNVENNLPIIVPLGSSSNFDAACVRQEIDPWLLTPDYLERHLQALSDVDNLPTYLEVLEEGNPPSPFLEYLV